MRSVRLFSMAFIFIMLGMQFLAAGSYTEAEKENIINKIMELKGLTTSRVSPAAPVEFDKCGTKYAIALSDIQDEIDPALLKTLLVRPTRQTYIDYGHFRIHYDTTGINAPRLTDVMPAYGVPDYIDSVALVFEYVWEYEVDSLGYGQSLENIIGFHGPMPDNGEGGSDAFDVYVSNIGQNYYGITWTECNQYHCPSYIEVDNDYAEPIYDSLGYGDRPMYALKVTAAHEFFHAIHYSLDRHEAGDNVRYWWQEASAVWMEDEVFDYVNDYLFSLPYFFWYPWLSLETYTTNYTDIGYLHPYASCIWPRFLEQRYDKDIIRQIWEMCGQINGYNVLPATDIALGNYGSSFDSAFQEFTVWNYFTAYRADTENKYAEANTWPDTIRTIYYTTSIPYDTLSASFYDLNTTPQSLAANYIVLNPVTPYPGGLTFWFNSTDNLQAGDEWRVNILGWDPAQNDYVRMFVNPSTNSGSAIFRGWQNYDNIVVIPSNFGYNYDDTSRGYALKTIYDQNLNDNSPTLCALQSIYQVTSGNTLVLDLCASDPNGDIVTFRSVPSPDSVTGLDSIITVSDTSAVLYFYGDYSLIDSTISITIYAEDPESNYDAKRVDFHVVYYSAQEAQPISIVGYPNPFYYASNQAISLRYFLPDSVEAKDIGIYIFNIAGDLVFTKKFVDTDWRVPGEAVYRWDARNSSHEELATGIYIIKLRAGDKSADGKIAIIR